MTESTHVPKRRAPAARINRPKRAVTFNTSQFRVAHGRTPRGRGEWAFIDAQFARRDDYLDFVLWVSLPYTDAKKVAAAHFAAQPNCSGEVVVLS